ncbi:uncharacterized protein [Dysidea avara]|uniref:uncharacterized protein isoform X2 n=1 Tax=Dysidea avara TaxID=196820 RepID=UPI00331BD28D
MSKEHEVIWVNVDMVLSGSRLSVGQVNRCAAVNMGAGQPRSCMDYYDSRNNEGFFNNTHRDMLRRTVDNISDSFRAHGGQCVNLTLHYLCYYYYPVCDLTTGVVMPSCTSSCNLLVNNQNCSDLLEEARVIINQMSPTVPFPEYDCARTYDTNGEPNNISEQCREIARTIIETLPLNCLSAENSPMCFPLLMGTHYAPNGSYVVTDRRLLGDELAVIIGQYGTDHQCVELIQTLTCLVTSPVCTAAEGKLTPICPQSCQTTDQIILECSMITVNFTSVNQLLTTINCFDPQSYYIFPSQNIEPIDGECISILNGTAATGGSSNDIAFIAVIVAGVIAAIIIIVIIVIAIKMILVIRRRRRIPKFFREPTERPSPEPVARYSTHHSNQLRLDFNYPSNANSPYAPHHGRRTGEESVWTSTSSLFEINQLIQYVKEKFSEVLLPAEAVTRLDFLGKGAFGIVHKGELVTSDGIIKAVAIKTIKSTSMDGMKDLIAETAIMKGFHHPNVLPLLGVCVDYDDDDVIKIVIPFMAHGDLRTFLKKSRVSPNNTHEYPKDLPEEVLKRMCLDIASGMEYLAEKRFVHRDLAARNCMVDESLRIKVADFGLARDIYSTEYYRIEKHTTLPVKWMALESLLDGYFDEKTDVWSYGVTCWEIFSLGRIPYPGVDNAEVIKTLKRGDRLDKPDLCPSDMYKMLENTWQEESERRPSFSDIVHTLSEGVEDTGVTNNDITVERTTSEPNDYIVVQES